MRVERCLRALERGGWVDLMDWGGGKMFLVMFTSLQLKGKGGRYVSDRTVWVWLGLLRWGCWGLGRRRDWDCGGRMLGRSRRGLSLLVLRRGLVSWGC